MNVFQGVTVDVVVFLGLVMMLPQQAQGQETTDSYSQVSSRAELLEGVEERNLSDWPWAVGGQYPDQIETESVYQIRTTGLLDPVKIEKVNQIYRDVDVGDFDFHRSSRRMPIAQF